MLGIALQQAYPQAKLELHNAGVSGNTAAAGLARLDRDVLACKPHLVVVMFDLELEPGVRPGGVGHDSDSPLGDRTGAFRR